MTTKTAEQPLDNARQAARRLGAALPRSIVAPAKPDRSPTRDEQRMADDFDPHPLAHIDADESAPTSR